MGPEIILALIALVSGGSLVAIYKAIIKNIKAKRLNDSEPEKYIRTLFENQVGELTTSIEAIRIKLEELVAVNARLGEENRSLRATNKELNTRIERTEKLVFELTSKMN